MTDYSKSLVRCHALHTIMTNISSKELTKGHLTFVRKFHRELKYSRRPQIKSKYIEKGHACEEDAITLLSRVKGTFFKKNEERIENAFLSGEPDLYIGESIRTALEGYDTKCSWDLDTFPFPGDDLPPEYEFQNHGYMALTGARKWTTAYCLVNATAGLIMAEKYDLMRKLGDVPDNHPAYIKGCIEIEKNLIYDLGQFQKDNPHFDLHSEFWEYDIPKEERVIQFTVHRDDNVIDKIYERVKLVRKELIRLSGRAIAKEAFETLTA